MYRPTCWPSATSPAGPTVFVRRVIQKSYSSRVPDGRWLILKHPKDQFMKTTSRNLAVVAILWFALPLVAQTPRRTDATSILSNMFRVYSRLASYQDEGILVTTNDEPTGGTIEKMPFKTFFKRPHLFRFEWTEFT